RSRGSLMRKPSGHADWRDSDVTAFRPALPSLMRPLWSPAASDPTLLAPEGWHTPRLRRRIGSAPQSVSQTEGDAPVTARTSRLDRLPRRPDARGRRACTGAERHRRRAGEPAAAGADLPDRNAGM